MTATAQAAAPQVAPSASPATPIVAVVHVDLDSRQVAAGTVLLQGYAQACRRAPGNLSFVLLREISRDNHFTLIETWRSLMDFKAHEDAAYTKHFRKAVQPLLGSPFDERLHGSLAPQ